MAARSFIEGTSVNHSMLGLKYGDGLLNLCNSIKCLEGIVSRAIFLMTYQKDAMRW